MDKAFAPSGPQPGMVFPSGWFTLPLRTDAAPTPGQLRLAASDLGVPRVELTFQLPYEPDNGILLALYEKVSFLWTKGYECDFERVPGSERVQLKAHIFISPEGPSDNEFLLGVRTAADEKELAHWIRVSFSACREVLDACAKAH